MFEVGKAFESLREWFLVLIEEAEWGQINGEGTFWGESPKGSSKVAIKISKGKKWSWRGC